MRSVFLFAALDDVRGFINDGYATLKNKEGDIAHLVYIKRVCYVSKYFVIYSFCRILISPKSRWHIRVSTLSHMRMLVSTTFGT